jgi:hypothetical protein
MNPSSKSSRRLITGFNGICPLFTLMIGLMLVIGCSPAQAQIAPIAPENAQTA